jgi:hypothetical protein
MRGVVGRMTSMRGLVLLAALAAAAAALAGTTAAAAPPVCKVPKLTGRTTAAAKAALKRAGCPASALKTATSCAAAAKVGVVLDQKPAAKAGLKKGQKISVHVGKLCSKPPPPPPPPAPPPASFAGDFGGTYTGTLTGSQGCPDIAISGLAFVAVAQQGSTSYDLVIQLQNAHVITTDMCDEIGRADSTGEIVASSNGDTLSATGFTATIAGDTLTGSIQTDAGQIAFTVTRS